MIRLLIQLNETEAEKLAHWAALEMRDPRDQVRFLIRQELLRQGLLPESHNQSLSAVFPSPAASVNEKPSLR